MAISTQESGRLSSFRVSNLALNGVVQAAVEAFGVSVERGGGLGHTHVRRLRDLMPIVDHLPTKQEEEEGRLIKDEREERERMAVRTQKDANMQDVPNGI